MTPDKVELMSVIATLLHFRSSVGVKESDEFKAREDAVACLEATTEAMAHKRDPQPDGTIEELPSGIYVWVDGRLIKDRRSAPRVVTHNGNNKSNGKSNERSKT